MKTSASRWAALALVVGVGASALVVGLRSDPAPSTTSAAEVEAEARVSSAATPELAARTVDRLQLLRTGNGGARLRLTGDEVTALLRHALPGVLPEGIEDPVVHMESGQVVVDARLVTRDFVGSAPLATVLGALPDTIAVNLRGTVAPAGGHLVLEVESAHAGHVPLPASAVASIASALAEATGHRVSTSPDRPSVGVPLPSGIGLVAVVDDRLVLDRDERLGQRAVDGSEDP
ncbi:MAG: hypothetical protein R3253_03275 [Longimicrobiales bacterium]|nr:hypothetical protein [Longimicrobiales bacterium]